jgi:protein TonB
MPAVRGRESGPSTRPVDSDAQRSADPSSSGQGYSGPQTSPGAAAAPGAIPGGPSQPADPQAPGPAVPSPPPPAAPVVPAPSPQPSAPVLTPPVPVTLDPPRHPDAWQIFVKAPGLAAGVRPQGINARVRLRLHVREDGAVADVSVAVPSGRPDLDAAAADAARTWRFQPARRDGAAIASVVLIWVSFVTGP